MISDDDRKSAAEIVRYGDSATMNFHRTAYILRRKEGLYAHLTSWEMPGVKRRWLPRTVADIQALGIRRCTGMHPHFGIAYFDGSKTDHAKIRVKEELGKFFDCVIDHSEGHYEEDERAQAELEFIAALVEWGLGPLPQSKDLF